MIPNRLFRSARSTIELFIRFRYAVYHGPAGLRKIAQRIHHSTVVCAKGTDLTKSNLETSQSGSKNDVTLEQVWSLAGT
jgi:glycine cleavage system pyridoxal-binding protein P